MASTIVPLSEIPTLSLLYRLQHLDPAIANNYEPSSDLNSLISFIRKDITTLEVSAIVNAANNSLLGGGGVDGAIHRAAGHQLVEECEKLLGCATGSAKITSAYELPCDKVIHAVGPIYWEAKKKKPGLEKELLRSCYRTSLDLAAQNGCKSIAFSALSTGVYGYPSSEAAKEAIGEVRDWVDENWKPDGSLERIVFVVFEMKDVRAYKQWLPIYFPATAEDLPHVKEDPKHDEMINELPDPPTAEPTEEGTPAVKKQKIESEKTDDEWEAIEKPEGYAENGLHDAKSKPSEETTKESVPTTSPHNVTVGSEELENRLGKDW